MYDIICISPVFYSERSQMVGHPEHVAKALAQGVDLIVYRLVKVVAIRVMCPERSSGQPVSTNARARFLLSLASPFT
jgi:hypothetical protein